MSFSVYHNGKQTVCQWRGGVYKLSQWFNPYLTVSILKIATENKIHLALVEELLDFY